ncbi:MAG TPA: class I SAM-dependent methyltransferase [Burkholderiaceae bacterium]|nr:class I SAM-dependent methyltransferase [Burkholderiaceae bacterium]
MSADWGIEFFDRQFRRQVGDKTLGLNPFEQAALPHLRGHVLDYGCGLGQLAIAAARAGCSVVALDASETAVEHLRQAAAAQNLKIDVRRADLRHHTLHEDFDSIVSIGLLMFFDCATAQRALADLKNHLRPGGTMVINVLVEGTTYMDMFDEASFCLFARDALPASFADWELMSSQLSDFPAPGGLNKSFCTVVARKPVA